MARQRITATQLAKTFNAAEQPVYVLDDEGTVVFCNRACCQWLGETAEELLGRRCAYRDDPDAVGPDAMHPDAVAAGLCPPPAAMAGDRLQATVSYTSELGHLHARQAMFIPLGTGPENVFGLIAILDAEDLAEPVEPHVAAWPSATESEPTELHDQIRQFRRQAASRFRSDGLLGNSPAMRRVRAQVELASGCRAGVLVIGPPGSGRQHVASAIHYGRDGESAGSLVPLACSVLGAELIHSTVTALATGSPLGEESARSTLLLGEIDGIPADAQAELAEVLLRRPFPLRLIATAAARLDEAVGRGEYREDLAAALSAVVIELPPLAERREDLPLLAQSFLERANTKSGRQLGGFTPEALDRLDAYGWPGNLDELAQTVAEAQAKADGPEVGPEDLPERIHLAADAAAHPPRPEQTIVLDEFLAEIETELIRRALARAKSNKAKAARLLGLTRPRLYRRMVQLGLEE